MTKIINGKKYDTRTATAVGKWSNGRSSRDFSYCTETLYRKRTGEYFLYGEGGPSSIYSQMVDQNSWMGSDRIIPLMVNDAKKWAEEKLSVDDYEKEFGEVDE